MNRPNKEREILKTEFTYPTLVADAFIKADGKEKKKFAVDKKTELAASTSFPIQAEAKLRNSQAKKSEPIAINPAKVSLITIPKSCDTVLNVGRSSNADFGRK